MRIIFALAILLLVSACGPGTSSTEADNFFNDGNYEKAIELYTDYLDGSPKHIKSLYNRGRAYEEMGELEKANQDYLAVLDIDEKHVQANLSLGINSFREGDAERALFYFGHSVSADPDNYKALVLRGRAFHKLGNFPSAMKDFDEAIRVNSEGGDAYFYRGIIHLESNTRKACVDFQKASNLDVKDAKKALGKYCM